MVALADGGGAFIAGAHHPAVTLARSPGGTFGPGLDRADGGSVDPVQEQLDRGPDSKEEEESVFKAKEDEPRVASAKKLIGAYLKCAQATLLYPEHSTIRTETLVGFAELLAEHVGEHGETTLSVGETTLSYGEDTVYKEENRQRSIAFRLFLNGIRRVTFRPGIRENEALGVVRVLTRAFDPGADLLKPRARSASSRCTGRRR